MGDITNFTSPLKLFDYLTTAKLLFQQTCQFERSFNKKNSVFIKILTIRMRGVKINKIISNLSKEKFFN